MMNFCEKEEIKIFSDNKPCVGARTILPITSDKEVKEIQKKPFINKRDVTFFVQYNKNLYIIPIKKGYTWDGATIPFGFRWIIGDKGNPKFLIPSCVHDKMCENKRLVGHDRHLSSLVFKELLLGCGLNKTRANIMFLAVDNYQKFIGGWKNA